LKHEQFLALPIYIRNFLAYNDTIKGKSSKSIDEYAFDLQTFFRYLISSRQLVSSEIEFNEIDISSVIRKGLCHI
jgi:hypothetical protein